MRGYAVLHAPAMEDSADPEVQQLEAFSGWLSQLGEDAARLADVLSNTEYPSSVRRPAASALNYLFKSLDLIEDGIEGLGYLDDAFVLRLAAKAAVSSDGAPESLELLAEQAGVVADFLGDDYVRLETFVGGLSNLTVRGRSVDQVLEDEAACEELVGEVRGWISRYEPPHLKADPKNLVKLRAFLNAKLPT